MPLHPGTSRSVFAENVREMMHSYQRKGKIGNSRPKTKRKALKQALAASYREKRSS